MATLMRLARARCCQLALLLNVCIAYGQSSTGSSTSSSTATVVVQGTRLQTTASSGISDYSLSSESITNMPSGDNTVLTDVLSQLPGVGIDQNQQVHIRDTEGSGFQYQVNGIAVPFDINTNPPFISMVNPLFIRQLDLIEGVLPSQYSYATGGVVSIQTKDGCRSPGGDAELFFGQRGMLQPSAQYAGCEGNLSYYGSVLYSQNNLAFSSATPQDNPLHDRTNQGQAFGVLSYAFNTDTKLSLIVSSADSDNQLPDVPGLPPAYVLAGAPPETSSQINSYLDFRDYLALLSLTGRVGAHLEYQVAYAVHDIAQRYEPDDTGELIYSGIATRAVHQDFDNILQGDLKYILGAHTIGAGFYLGAYNVTADSYSLVFPVNTFGGQSSAIPLAVVNDLRTDNILSGVYIDDLWQINRELRASFGVRRDQLTGMSPGEQWNPSVNLAWSPSGATTVHAGLARYFQVPSFEGIAPRAPMSYAGTTGEGPPGATSPLDEDDWEADAGVVHTLQPGLSIAADTFVEYTRHYLDAGQFGSVPIFAPFNYEHGHLWGAELALDYVNHGLATYTNVTVGRNYQKGVATGQFNFSDPGELEYLDSHYIVLDHQPLLTVTSGVNYTLGSYKLTADALYNTGLRTGFANLQSLPHVFQINAGLVRSFTVAGHRWENRLVLENLLDRVNLIRPAGGLGVFQSAYGPRFTLFDAVSLYF